MKLPGPLVSGKRDAYAAVHLHVSPQPTIAEYATQNYQIPSLMQPHNSEEDQAVTQPVK